LIKFHHHKNLKHSHIQKHTHKKKRETNALKEKQSYMLYCETSWEWIVEKLQPLRIKTKWQKKRYKRWIVDDDNNVQKFFPCGSDWGISSTLESKALSWNKNKY
jgi:hypothetical protein